MLSNFKRYSEPTRPLSAFTEEEIAAALRTVVNYTITTVFNLTKKETQWVAQRLLEVTGHLFVGSPSSVPVPVLQELNTHYYSMALLNKNDGGFVVAPSPQDADLVAFVDIFMEMSTASYEFSSFDQTHLYVSLMEILSEIGVRDENSRLATYLPNAIKSTLLDR